MVNRPPPKAGAASKGEDADGAITTNGGNARHSGPRRGLEWSLRGMHKIDTSAQHFLTSYYGEDDDGSSRLFLTRKNQGRMAMLEIPYGSPFMLHFGQVWWMAKK